MDAAQHLVDAAAFFSQRGWLLGTCGNLSIKLQDDPFQLVVTPSGRDKSRLSRDEMLVVGREGDPRASAELGVHVGVYGRTEAGAIYHVHSVFNNLASRYWRHDKAVRFEDVEMIKGLAGKRLHDVVDLPIVDNSDDMAQLAANVVEGMRPGVPGVLVYQHGLYAWGRTPDEARRHVEILEFLLEFVVRAYRP